MEEEIARLSEIATGKKEAAKEAEAKVKAQKESLKACSESITAKSREKGQLLKEANNSQLNLKV